VDRVLLMGLILGGTALLPSNDPLTAVSKIRMECFDNGIGISGDHSEKSASRGLGSAGITFQLSALCLKPMCLCAKRHTGTSKMPRASLPLGM